MAGFLYYVSGGHSGMTLVDLARAGLGHAFERPPAKTEVLRGPDGQAGLVVADERTLGREIRYIPDQQTWRRLVSQLPTPNSQLVPWVGLYRGDRPGPEDLARKEQLQGHWVRLADDRDWLCPIARGWAEQDGQLRWYHSLPQVLELDEQGQWRHGPVLARYAPLWDLALQWDETLLRGWEERNDAESGEEVVMALKFQGAVEAAVRALGVNYRIGPTEAAMLGILTGPLAGEILNALVDLPTRREWAEKKMTNGAHAGGNIADGARGSTPAIGPP